MARWRWIWGMLCVASALWGQPATLAERLGYARQDRLLIINADDAGLTHSENLATLDAMRRGLVGSSTLMAPCPWFPEIAAAAAADPKLDFGVHLVVTSEWDTMRWGPVLGRTAVPSMVDAQGYLIGSVRALHAKATFDAPDAGRGAGQGTRPSTNNGKAAVAGWYVDANSLNHGFVWNRKRGAPRSA